MIFSSEKWGEASEMQPYVSVASSTNFTSLQAPLRNAFDAFIRVLLGEATTQRLLTIYAAPTPTAKELRFLELAQAANAFLAFWYDFNEMQLFIDDSGSHSQESDRQKRLYKYQEQQLRDGWKNKGFGALDNLLEYLEVNADVFTEFAASTNFTVLKKEIVRSTKEVNDVYWINNSRILFLRLKPHFRIVIDTIIAPRLGTIYTEMLDAFGGAEPVAVKYKTLREKLVPVVVFYAVNRLLRESGSLTERGMFFEVLTSSADAYNTQALNPDQVAPQAAMAEGDAISYWTLAEKYLKAEFSYSPAGSVRLPKFNNDDKKYFVV